MIAPIPLQNDLTRNIRATIAVFALFFSCLAFAATSPQAEQNQHAPNKKKSIKTTPSSPSANNTEIENIITRGYIVVAMPANDSPPFFFVRDGKLMGIDVEFAQGLAADLGVTVKFDRSAISTNDALNLVTKGDADIAWCKMSRTMARAKNVNFSKAYLSMRHSMAINRVQLAELTKDGRDITKVIRDFDGEIAVIAGTSWVGYAEKHFPKAKLVELKDFDEVVKAVGSGKVAAAYRDEFEIKRLIKLDPKISLNVRTVTLTDLDDTLGVAVNPKYNHLLAFINMFIDKQVEKLTVDKILKKYESWLQ